MAIAESARRSLAEAGPAGTRVAATLYSDPACPWAYSISPALRVLEWRYRSQLSWRLVLIGLSEDAGRYEQRGFTAAGMAIGQLRFRRYGMPLSPAPKPRLAATGRACRAVVAARLSYPGSEWRVFRALQLANFTSPLLLDDDADLAEALRDLRGIDADAIVASLDNRAVVEAYRRDKDEARRAANSPAQLQGKTREEDGLVRFTAPSIVFEGEREQLVAGGFQPVEAYDVLVVNLDPTLGRRQAPETPAPLLEQFADGLTTQEVAALLVRGNDQPDRAAAEEALLELVGAGAARRLPLGDDAVWIGA